MKKRIFAALPVLAPVAVASVLYTLAVSTYPLPPMIHDALAYTRTAQRLLSEHVFSYTAGPGAPGPPNAIVTPGYVVFLSTLYAFFGRGASGVDAIRSAQPAIVVAQLLLGLGTVAAIAETGRRLGGRKLALVTGFAAAAYLPFGWASSVALSESLGAFLVAAVVALGVALTSERTDARAPALWALYGVAWAVLALVRPAYSLWPLLPVMYVIARRLEPPRRLVMGVAVMAAGALLLLAPWWVRNAVVLHRFVPLRTDAGRAAFDATGGGDLTADEQQVYDAAEREGRDPYAAVSGTRMSAEFARDAAAFVKTRLYRSWLSASSPWVAVIDVMWEQNFDYDVDRVDLAPDFAPLPSETLLTLIRATRVYQEVLIALALVGLLFARRSPRLLLVASVPLYAVAVHFMTLFSDRYFFPATPALVVMGAASAYGLWGAGRRALRARREADARAARAA